MTRSPDDDRGWRPPPDEGQAGMVLLPNGWWGYRYKAGVRPLMVEKPEEHEYRKLLTCNNIQKHPKTSPTTPPPDPAPLPHNHRTRTPRRHPKTPAPHTPNNRPGACHHRRSNPKTPTPNPPTPTKHTPHRHLPPNANRGRVITAGQHHKTSTPAHPDNTAHSTFQQ